ncbi:MAG: hypothetical protein Q7Q71_05455 [Verrucomicrobiota bacterium JB023]|nr:hypothetical protein [Verrucomicrobiota bacterium JB023]
MKRRHLLFVGLIALAVNLGAAYWTRFQIRLQVDKLLELMDAAVGRSGFGEDLTSLSTISWLVELARWNVGGFACLSVALILGIIARSCVQFPNARIREAVGSLLYVPALIVLGGMGYFFSLVCGSYAQAGIEMARRAARDEALTPDEMMERIRHGLTGTTGQVEMMTVAGAFLGLASVALFFDLVAKLGIGRRSAS